MDELSPFETLGAILDREGNKRSIAEPYRSRITSSIFTPPDGPKSDFGVFAIMEGAHAPDLYAMLLVHAVELHDEQTPEEIYQAGQKAQTENLPTFCGLPRGLLLAERRMESPYVIHFREQGALSDWLIDEGWGKGWGIWGWADMAAAGRRAQPGSDALSQGAIANTGLGLQTRESVTPAKQPGIDDPNAPRPQALVHVLARHFRKFGQVEQESDGRILYLRFFDPHVLNSWVPTLNGVELGKLFGTDGLIQGLLAERFAPSAIYSQPSKIERFRPGNWLGSGKVELVRHIGDVEKAQILRPVAVTHEQGQAVHDTALESPFKLPSPLELAALQHWAIEEQTPNAVTSDHAQMKLRRRQEFAFEQKERLLYPAKMVEFLLRDFPKQFGSVDPKKLEITAQRAWSRATRYGFTKSDAHYLFFVWSAFYGDDFERGDPAGTLEKICLSTEEDENARFLKFKQRFSKLGYKSPA